MADTPIPSLTSFSTAVVILPPPHVQLRLNAFRDGNDKSFPRWTSHLTLLFPFVEPSYLPAACSLIRESFAHASLSPFSFRLDKVGQFKQRDYDTVYLGATQTQDISRVWNAVASIMGYSGRPFVPHLTLGQAYKHERQSLTFLNEKGQLLLQDPPEWDIHSVIVLRKSDVDGGQMKLYDEIPLVQASSIPSMVISGLQPTAYRYDSTNWISSRESTPNDLSSVNIATYNVLHTETLPSTARLSRIVEILVSVNPVPDAICLQEVTDAFLKQISSHSQIQARWPACTHNPNSVLPNERNVVCLAREGLSFSWESIHLRKHKPAIILQIPRKSSDSLIVPVVHLTAGLDTAHKRTKEMEVNALLTTLQQRFSSNPWILAGDFNFTTSDTVAGCDDAWLVMHGSEEGGMTYDPSTNSLAAQTVRESQRPQRYDRIFLRSGKDLSVKNMQLFGEDGASDHYGLVATIALSSQVAKSSATSVSNVIHTDINDIPDEDLEIFIRQDGGFMTPSQEAAAAKVVPTLKKLLAISSFDVNIGPSQSDGEEEPTIRPSVVKFEAVPVGSYGLGTATESSDIDVLVVGNISPSTFWSLFRLLLHKYISKQKESVEDELPVIKLKRFVKEAAVPMMELMVGDMPVDLQYCSAPGVLERWRDFPNLELSDSVFLLPALSLRTLSSYITLHAIQRVIPTTTMPGFRLAYRALKTHCLSEGIYSNKFGYLSGIHLVLLLTRIAVLSPAGSSAQHLLRAFFATYAYWDWANQIVIIPGLNDEAATKYARQQAREPMVILSVHKPTFNKVHYANKHTLAAISASFKRTHERLARGETWINVANTGGLYGTALKRFLDQSGFFVKVDVAFWCSSSIKARAWVGFVQSRLQHFLVSLQNDVPMVSARLWPARLADSDDPGDPVTGLRSFFLINVHSPVESASVRQKCTVVQQTLEDFLQRDEKFYDPKEMFVSVLGVDASMLPVKLAAAPEWIEGDVDPLDDLDEEELGHQSHSSDENQAEADTAASVKSAKKKKHRDQETSKPIFPETSAKLRTSIDIYNRLLWDREFNADDYVIGYEDRFKGVQEIALTSWKRDTDHEEFIPFHRVMHFRRKSDNVVIWDRKKRVDLVFHSGMQSTAKKQK